MVILNPYLTFKGNCEEAFNFYRSVFGGEFGYIGRFNEMPADQGEVSEADKNKIMHVSLPLSDGNVLMGSDEWGDKIRIGDNVGLSITVQSKADADRIYEALTKGGQATMPMSNTFWGSYYGMGIDKFGINWMVSFNENQPAGA